MCDDDDDGNIEAIHLTVVEVVQGGHVRILSSLPKYTKIGTIHALPMQEEVKRK